MGSHEEIVIDILSRLAVKSLLRFKCVSKFWNTSISDPYFKKKHLNLHQNSPKLLISQPHSNCNFCLYSSSLSSSAKLVKDTRKLYNPSSFKPFRGRVYCCCDGLALIGIWSTMNEEETPRLLLWNPSTRESILLPSHLEIPPQDEYIYGMGYDTTNDDYKILRIDVYDEIPDEILALKSGSWRKIEGRTGSPIISLRELCLAFVHGAFHCVAVYPTESLVSLNISNESYEEILLPKILLSPRSFLDQVGVSVLGGKLSIYNNNEDLFCIWVLEDYDVKESWTKWFTLSSYGVVPGCYIIPIYKFSDDEVLFFYYNFKETVYRTYNRSLEVSNRIWPLHCDHIDARSILDGLVYTESLISPKLVTKSGVDRLK